MDGGQGDRGGLDAQGLGDGVEGGGCLGGQVAGGRARLGGAPGGAEGLIGGHAVEVEDSGVGEGYAPGGGCVAQEHLQAVAVVQGAAVALPTGVGFWAEAAGAGLAGIEGAQAQDGGGVVGAGGFGGWEGHGVSRSSQGCGSCAAARQGSEPYHGGIRFGKGAR